MSNVHLHSVEYFKAPDNYFWRWTENGEVIEWNMEGKTICYRQDLINILTEISEGGPPPLSPLLLVIAACNTGFDSKEASTLQHFKFVANANMYDCQPAIDFLSLIPKLPEAFRTGNGRIHLIHHIFKQPNFSLFAPVSLKSALEDLSSGHWQDQLLTPGQLISPNEFQWHLSYFERALQQTPSLESLVQLLRTGMTGIPGPAPLELPAPAGGSLFEQLSQDPALSPLGRLAERLIPVLHIPMHTQGTGKYPYGGISDITNRGNYDKLLLSELAHDDLTLTARLVNGEALYYRREVPPDKPTNRRILLIDATLKMWGIPRLFAIASALAFTHNLKKREGTEAYMLEGHSCVAVNLGDAKGITQAMGILHYALHCGNALQQFLQDHIFTEDDELVLITDTQSYRNPGFMAAYNKAKETIRYLINVNRTGELEFRAINNGRSKVLGAAKLDLEDIIQTPSKPGRRDKLVNIQLPIFYSHRPYPLLLPLPLKLETLTHCEPGGNKLVAVNKHHQVLFFPEQGKGAIELLECIDKGVYRSLVLDADNSAIAVINSNNGLIKCYLFNLDTLAVKEYDYRSDIGFPKHLFIRSGKIYVKNHDGLYLIEKPGSRPRLLTNEEDQGWHLSHEDKELPSKNSERYHQYLRRPGNYSSMFRAKHIYINAEKQLVFGIYALTLREYEKQLQWQEPRKAAGPTEHLAAQTLTIPNVSKNRQLRFNLRKFRDGSEVLMDSRGFIHLRSSNDQIPEICIVFISGYPTAAWASNGKCCGPRYFFTPLLLEHIPGYEFNNLFLQPFIDHILQHEASA